MVVPKVNASFVNIVIMDINAFFAGAIGKVAVYDKLLPAAQIKAHYVAMTGKQPTGSCAATCNF